MRDGAIVLFALILLMTGCASSKPESSEIRIVNDRQQLAGCAKVGLLPLAEGGGGPALPGGISPQIRARVTSLGGNVLFRDIFAGARTNDEVWSCPVDNVVVPR